jgi:TolB-like protein
MPSVVPRFEYDIFISYRHKDNKGEHWVSGFVTALKTELESTFKEDISIYFDENPHDGLLETHDVNKSLEGKLKCLIFIPIISQTYCDPKSFAWQHEFLAFKKIVAEPDDPFGREIKLKNGNVASRILPIKIHDIDLEDKQLLEGELGGVLRGVEFIYKSAGVNRPLRPNDDRSTNLNHTYYRDQINKVANAIKEIVTGITHKTSSNLSQEPVTVTPASSALNKKRIRTKRNVVIAILTAVLLVVSYSIFQFSSAKIKAIPISVEKSIAVLPFKNIGPNDTDEYFSDGMTEEVINSLAKVGELKVMSRTSVEQYKATGKNSKAIGDELGVSFLLEGSVRKSGSKFRISVQLIQTETGFQVWSNEYDKEMTDVFQMQSDISREVTNALKIMLTDEEKKNIQNQEVVELTAYDFYLKARSELMNYRLGGPVKGLPHGNKAIDLFTQAIRINPSFARAYTGIGIALIYKGNRGIFVDEILLDSAKRLADRALQFDANVDEAYFIRGLFYSQVEKDNKSAIAELNKALAINPNYVDAMMSLGSINAQFNKDYVTGLGQMQRALQLGRGPELTQNLKTIALLYDFLGLSDEALEYLNSAAQLDGDSTALLGLNSALFRRKGDYETALKLVSRAQKIDATDFFANDGKAWALTLLGRNQEALDVRLKWDKSIGSVSGFPVFGAHRIGHLYWMLGDKKSAMKYFKLQIAYDEKSIQQARPGARVGYDPYDLACVHAFLGEKEKAYYYLDQVNDVNFAPVFLLQLFKDDPMFASIRGEDRFKKIQLDLEEKNKKERDRVLAWLQNQSLKTKLTPKL